jgi:competence protein ComEC
VYTTLVQRNDFLRLGILIFALCACVGVWALVFAAPRGGIELTFAVLDVGQGDALYIESPTGVQVLIDGGPDSAVLRELPKVMPQFDRSLDAVIATHPDADHIGGLVDVLHRYEVGAFFEPGVAKNTAAYRALKEEVSAQGAEHRVAQRGMTLDLGGGARLLVLYPSSDVSATPDTQANDASIVALLQYGSSTALLLGDAPKFVEYALAVQNEGLLESDVLKVGHHGSRTSTSDILLAAAQPALAVISAGRDNRFGHPHTEVLNTLARHGAEVLLTAQEGTIVFKTRGGDTFYREQ